MSTMEPSGPRRPRRDRRPLRLAGRTLAYTWAAPTTLVGALAGALTLATGGRAQYRRGTLEFHGGFSTWLARKWRFGAMTLGHVVVGRDPASLDDCRDHEQAHVRQAERWGPLFIPAYLAASFWVGLRGRHYYLDNPFEIDARRRCGQDRHSGRGAGFRDREAGDPGGAG